MQNAKAFEMVKRDDTATGDILQIMGCWAMRLEGDRILYLNGHYEGHAERVSEKPCLRLRGYRGLTVEFDELGDATCSQSDSKNPLVHVANGYAFHAVLGQENVLFNLLGEKIESEPSIRAGRWTATAHRKDQGSPLKIF